MIGYQNIYSNTLFGKQKHLIASLHVFVSSYFHQVDTIVKKPCNKWWTVEEVAEENGEKHVLKGLC